MDLAAVRTDLVAEQEALDAVVAELDPTGWSQPTPSEPWTVADQIAHLAYFDRTAAVAITDPDAFASHAAELWETVASGHRTFDEETLGSSRGLTGADLLTEWRRARRDLAAAASRLDDGDRVPWYGPSMGARSFLTARLMETWAHGQDVVDAVGVEREPTDRLVHVAHLGFITRAWSYANRGRAMPETPVRVELAAPSGTTWTFGDPDTGESIVGPAEDFCLVVTQRRHVDDTSLVTTELGREWMLIAQAFAGPPTTGPEPRTRG